MEVVVAVDLVAMIRFWVGFRGVREWVLGKNILGGGVGLVVDFQLWGVELG